MWACGPTIRPLILQAVKQAKKEGKVKIVAFDEEDETLQGVKDGHIYCTIVQQPYEFGYQSVRLLASIVRGDKSVLPADGVLARSAQGDQAGHCRGVPRGAAKAAGAVEP